MPLKVGIYENSPKIWRDDSGRGRRFWPRLIDEISRQRQWPVTYVPCLWSDCLDMLTKGEIDVLPDVAHSAERAGAFSFGREVVLHSWSQVFHRPEQTISGILDLSGLRVAVLAKSIQHDRLAEQLERFGIKGQFVLVRSLTDALESVVEGDAHAAVVNKFIGARQLGLVPSGIVVAPSNLHFAFAPGLPAEIRTGFDDVIAGLKAVDGSVYYTELEKLAGGQARQTVSTIIYWVLGVGAGVLVFSVIAVVVLRRLVATRTRELTDEIAERAEAERALKASEANLKATINHSPFEVFLKDTDGRYLIVNRWFEEHFGLDRHQAIGKTDFDLFPAAMAAACQRQEQDVLAKRTAIAREEQLELATGTRTLVTTKFPILDVDGRVSTIGGIATDITDRKQAERAILASKEEVEFDNRAKSEFLANMSHELRTPLNAIVGFSEALANETFGPLGSPKNGEFAAAIYEAGTHLTQVIGDILDISKIGANEMVVDETVVDVHRVLKSCVTMIAPKAEAADVALSVDMDEKVPLLRADEQHVKQIILNLLSNAVKFTPTGGRISGGARHNDGHGIEIVVTDTGIGIDERDIKIIMEFFGQVAESFRRDHGGTGLGLPICDSLTKLHGGSLEIDSTVGEGTTVTVRFPADRTIRAKRAS